MSGERPSVSLVGPAGLALSSFDVVRFGVVMGWAPSCLATWFLRCPGQSVGWDTYGLSIVHLRPVGAIPDAVITLPRATHQVFLGALDPEKKCTPDPGTWRYLFPLNLSEQVELPSDESAVEVLRLCAQAVVDGGLWAEPPLSGQVEPWRTTLIRTSAHARGEPHAS